MREIEFRGKRTCDNEWTYGWFIGIYQTEDGDVGCIRDYTGKDNLVKLETVGQYTGLKDKNGKKIFEGDIVRYIDNDLIEYVEFIDGVFFAGSEELRYAYCEVIGNIYDNPELLEEQDAQD